MGITRHSTNGLRWYIRADGLVERINTDETYMSVTTVLKFLEEDMTGLERWKKSNDGVGDNAHHEHIYWYSGPRGTLCHYQALCLFEDSFDKDEDMWGEEEGESMEKIVEGPDSPEPCHEHEMYRESCKYCYDGTFEDASHNLSDITYSILYNQDVVTSREQYETLFKGNTRLVDVLREDIEYFTDAFKTICDELGVTDDSVCRVEKFMLNTGHKYGGQCDMVYEDEGGNIVVADLKTSSGLRQKHRLQSVAYMKSVEDSAWGPETVDRVEVWRIAPDAENWQVHANTVPEHAKHLYDEDNPETCRYTDEYWFTDKWGDFDYDSIEDMWDKFQELTERAHKNEHA